MKREKIVNIIEINIEKDAHPLLSSLMEENVRSAVAKILELLSLNDKEVSLYFCENVKICELNKTYRNKDYPTDVLSFESGEDTFLGDIAISVEKAEEQKKEFDSPTLDHEILRLIIHGILHLIGYDHEISEEKACIMRNKEDELISEVEKLNLYQN